MAINHHRNEKTLVVTLPDVPLVEEIGIGPAFSSENADVRLKIGSGCLDEGQVVGPTTFFPDKRYVVEFDNQRSHVSVVVDCHRAASLTFRWVLTYVSEDHRAKGWERRIQAMKNPASSTMLRNNSIRTTSLTATRLSSEKV